MSNTEGVLEVLKAIESNHFQLDILVNNAGLFVYSAADTVTAEGRYYSSKNFDQTLVTCLI